MRPGEAGQARKPPRYLAEGSVVVTEISGPGRLENQVGRMNSPDREWMDRSAEIFAQALAVPDAGRAA